jgi:large subunit ribosomal protein L19
MRPQHARGYLPAQLRKKQLEYYLTNEPPAKVPLADRLPSPRYLLKQLEQEEIKRVVQTYPRELERFYVGDKIKVERYIVLGNAKVEVTRGMVIEKKGGDELNASFSIINRKLGMEFELQIPLYSPFLKSITVIQKGSPKYAGRSKIRWMKDRPPQEWEC